jgi:hypothetical protein
MTNAEAGRILTTVAANWIEPACVEALRLAVAALTRPFDDPSAPALMARALACQAETIGALGDQILELSKK